MSMVAPRQQLLWSLGGSGESVQCQMLTCCAGAELQIIENDAVTIRELYPDKSDLYERARVLKIEFERTRVGQTP